MRHGRLRGSRDGTWLQISCGDRECLPAIVQHPLLWRLRPGGYRRVNLPGFPYYVAFVTDAEQALVVAIAHSSRHPDYFKNRMP